MQSTMQDRILAHEVNRFNGVEIRVDLLPQRPEEFRHMLSDSLKEWSRQGHPVVWLEVTIEHSQFIAPATAMGFVFHHSTERTLTLLYTFDEGASVPTYATHFIGAGGVVLNGRGELLVVNESHRRDRSRPYYKLPGGALKPGEHLIDGVKREIYEETGVDATFEALIGFRHWHGYRWDKSDIYFICRLSASSEQITVQPGEIDEAKWMAIDAYLASEYVSVFNKRVVRASIECPGIPPEEIEGYTDHARFEFFMPL